MAFGTSKIQAMHNRVGDPVTLGGTTVYCLIDVQDLAPAGPEFGSLSGKWTTVEHKTGSLPGMAAGVALTIRGTSYKVQEVRRIDDGEVSVAYCAEG